MPAPSHPTFQSKRNSCSALMPSSKRRATTNSRRTITMRRLIGIPSTSGKGAGSKFSNVRVLKLPTPDTFQATWDETRTDYNTTVAQASSWRATMKVERAEASDRNPIGLYITTLDWAEE